MEGYKKARDREKLEPIGICMTNQVVEACQANFSQCWNFSPSNVITVNITEESNKPSKQNFMVIPPLNKPS